MAYCVGPPLARHLALLNQGQGRPVRNKNKRSKMQMASAWEASPPQTRPPPETYLLADPGLSITTVRGFRAAQSRTKGGKGVNSSGLKADAHRGLLASSPVPPTCPSLPWHPTCNSVFAAFLPPSYPNQLSGFEPHIHSHPRIPAASYQQPHIPTVSPPWMLEPHSKGF